MTRDRTFKLALVTVLVLVIGVPTAAAPPDDKLVLPNAGWLEVGSGSAGGGGISNTSEDSTVPAIAVTSGGTFYVAWSDESNENDEIYVKRWDGVSWTELNGSASGGGVSSNSGSSGSPAVAVAPDGTFYVAWSDDSSGNDEIYVRRWNGASWVEVGAGSASGGGISGTGGESAAPSMAVAPDGKPYVAWHEATGGGSNREIYVKRWSGTAWEGVGGSATGGGVSQNSGFSYDPSMDIASGGAVYVAWWDQTSGNSEIYVRQWTGAVWAEAGAGSASGGGISRVGGESFAFSPSLALTPDGTPYVGWEALHSGGIDIRIRRWSGTVWEEVGVGSASGGGISGGGQSTNPSLAISSDGTPYVTWEYGGGTKDIYVKRWNGQVWTEVGVGSANVGGISDNSGASRVPAMVISSSGRPYVAWADMSGGDSEIYVRRARAQLEASPIAFTLFAEIGGDDPAPQAISVEGIGGAIDWTATVSPTVSWLSTTPVTGTTPTIVTMTVTSSGLVVGQYTAQVVIEGGAEVADSPQIVDVKLIVVEYLSRAYLPLISRNASSQ